MSDRCETHLKHGFLAAAVLLPLRLLWLVLGIVAVAAAIAAAGAAVCSYLPRDNIRRGPFFLSLSLSLFSLFFFVVANVTI